MHVSRTAIVIAGLCLLAACGQTPGGNGTAGASGAPGAAGGGGSGPDQVISFADLPHLRAGLWQSTLDDGDGKPSVTTNCESGRTPTMQMPKNCAQFTLKRTFLGHIVMDMNCASPQFTMVSHAEMSGDFQSSLSSDMTMTITEPGQPPKETKMHSDFKYVGPCAPGQTPDDAPDTNAPG